MQCDCLRLLLTALKRYFYRILSFWGDDIVWIKVKNIHSVVAPFLYVASLVRRESVFDPHMFGQARNSLGRDIFPFD